MARQAEILLGGDRRKRSRGRRRLVLAAGTVLLALLCYPHVRGARLPAPGEGGVDAILVLAGGENRIQEGLRLLRQGAGRELHVLGAGHGATLPRVVPGYDALSPEERGRIHLESWSENTLENAASAKSVVLERGFRSVLLVTSDYHVARASLALRRTLPPAVAISVRPVRGERRERGWYWKRPRLYLEESLKYWGFLLLLPAE